MEKLTTTNEGILKNLDTLAKLLEENNVHSKKRKLADVKKDESDTETDDYDGETFFVCFSKITASKKRGWSFNIEYILCDGTEKGKVYVGTFTELSKKDLYPKLMSNILAEGWVTSEFKTQIDELIKNGTLESGDNKHQSLFNVQYMPKEKVLSAAEVKKRVSEIKDGNADPSEYITAERELLKA
jgi:hypothetical protein